MPITPIILGVDGLSVHLVLASSFQVGGPVGTTHHNVLKFVRLDVNEYLWPLECHTNNIVLEGISDQRDYRL